jgi:hypothetical protein
MVDTSGFIRFSKIEDGVWVKTGHRPLTLRVESRCAGKSDVGIKGIDTILRQRYRLTEYLGR